LTNSQFKSVASAIAANLIFLPGPLAAENLDGARITINGNFPSSGTYSGYESFDPKTKKQKPSSFYSGTYNTWEMTTNLQINGNRISGKWGSDNPIDLAFGEIKTFSGPATCFSYGPGYNNIQKTVVGGTKQTKLSATRSGNTIILTWDLTANFAGCGQGRNVGHERTSINLDNNSCVFSEEFSLKKDDLFKETKSVNINNQACIVEFPARNSTKIETAADLGSATNSASSKLPIDESKQPKSSGSSCSDISGTGDGSTNTCPNVTKPAPKLPQRSNQPQYISCLPAAQTTQDCLEKAHWSNKEPFNHSKTPLKFEPLNGAPIYIQFGESLYSIEDKSVPGGRKLVNKPWNHKPREGNCDTELQAGETSFQVGIDCEMDRQDNLKKEAAQAAKDFERREDSLPYIDTATCQKDYHGRIVMSDGFKQHESDTSWWRGHPDEPAAWCIPSETSHDAPQKMRQPGWSTTSECEANPFAPPITVNARGARGCRL
jgi:hypothetical protein